MNNSIKHTNGKYSQLFDSSVDCWSFEREQKFKSRLGIAIYGLIFCTCMPLLLGSSAVVSIAAPKTIVQEIPGDSINRPTLKIGSQGQPVSELQASLKLLGFYKGPVDGMYNQTTANAVSQFKQAAGLNPDGIVDVSTWQRLFPSGQVAAPSVSAPDSTTKPSSSTKPTNITNDVNSNLEPKPATPRRATSAREQKQPTQQSSSRPQSTTQEQSTARSQSTSEELRILREGMSGSDVTKLQKRLQTLGFFKADIDGDFGAETVAAVKAAQEQFGIDADGVVGPATWEAIMRRRR